MTKLNRDDVQHVARLASLEIDEDEVKDYMNELSDVIEFFSQLEEVKTDDVDPTSQTTGLENVNRSDNVNKNRVIDQKSAISQAKDEHNGYFLVPMILTEKQ